MTAVHPIDAFRNMSNQFTDSKGDLRTINFVNKTTQRDSVSLIEITSGKGTDAAIRVDPEDNVAMALAVLGVGRVTDSLERQAQDRATMIKSDNYGTDIDGVLTQAIVNLRAILIAKEREQQDSEKLIEEAYNLYKLSYPNSTKDLATFREGKSNCGYWVVTLKRIRKDPTALGSL